MRQIDKLMERAREALGCNKRLTTAFITLNPMTGKWGLVAYLWNGIRGAGVNTLVSTHDTLDQAEAEAERIAQEYPNRDSEPVIIVDDLSMD